MAEKQTKQEEITEVMRRSADTLINYAAKEVPALGNLTPEGLLDELGWINELKKHVEKVEKILKERLKSQTAKKQLAGDVFKMDITASERTALDQGAAKALLESLGETPPMKTSEVETMRISRL